MKRMLRVLLLMGSLVGGLFFAVYGIILAQDTVDPVEPLWTQNTIEASGLSDPIQFKDAVYAESLSSRPVTGNVPVERMKRYRADCNPASDGTNPYDPVLSVQCWSDIAVAGVTEQGWEIFVLRADGAEVRQLTNNSGADVNPVLNQRATELIFTSDRDGNTEIYRIATDGTGDSVRLTENPASDDWAYWSPDGSQVVFASNRDGDWEIYVMNRDGTGVRQVSFDDESIDTMPTWSPDGGTIAWVKRQGRTGEIWMVNGDGSNPRKVFGPKPYLGHPRWSVDGSKILFDADMDGDYWNELAVFDGQYGNETFDANADWQDLWAGAWQPATTLSEEYILLTRVLYRVEGNQVYLDDIRVEAQDISSFYMPTVVSSEVWIGLATAPDWKISDTSAPIITLDPLPPKRIFTRSNSVQVTMEKEDPGNSGIATVEVQYRLDDGEWKPLAPDSYHQVFNFEQMDAVGHTVSFIARAMDRAGNWSGWTPDAGENRTFLYRGEFTGWVTDFRDRLLPGVTIDAPTLWLDHSTPTSWPPISGQIPLDGYHVLTATIPGYKPGRLEMDVTADNYWFGNQQLKLYPVNPFFDDPGFESGQLLDWQTDSPSHVRVSSAAAYEGKYGLRLGPIDSRIEPSWSISASVALTLPVEMNSPYLFFNSKFSDEPIDDRDHFVILVADANGVSELFRDSSTDIWGSYEIPLNTSPGQVITLTLEMDVEGEMLNSQMLIDNLYVGNWSTPAITDFSLEYQQPITDVTRSSSITATLTITGENFARIPTIKVGTTNLKNVRYISSERLEATIPANLPSGIHDLWVWNPGGAAALRPDAIRSGNLLFLPSLQR